MSINDLIEGITVTAKRPSDRRAVKGILMDMRDMDACVILIGRRGDKLVHVKRPIWSIKPASHPQLAEHITPPDDAIEA